MKRFAKSEAGSIAIEAALIMPVFILLLAVSAEIGLAQFGKQALVYSVQVAAQQQAAGTDPAASFTINTANTPANGATVQCATAGATASCTGVVTIGNVFAGLLHSGDWNFTYTAQAAVPPAP